MEWKKMSVIARELGVSKEVVKYHRKSLNKEWIHFSPSGEILISSEGIAYIQSKLRKEHYEPNFEAYVRQQLNQIEGRLELIDELLLKKLVMNNTPSQEEQKTIDPVSLVDQLKLSLDASFIRWYCQKEQLDTWDEWRWNLINLPDILTYLEQTKK